eukprot:gene14213-16805_t
MSGNKAAAESDIRAECVRALADFLEAHGGQITGAQFGDFYAAHGARGEVFKEAVKLHGKWKDFCHAHSTVFAYTPDETVPGKAVISLKMDQEPSGWHIVITPACV